MFKNEAITVEHTLTLWSCLYFKRKLWIRRLTYAECLLYINQNQLRCPKLGKLSLRFLYRAHSTENGQQIITEQCETQNPLMEFPFASRKNCVCVQRQLQICALTAQQLSGGEPIGVELQEGQGGKRGRGHTKCSCCEDVWAHLTHCPFSHIDDDAKWHRMAMATPW